MFFCFQVQIPSKGNLIGPPWPKVSTLETAQLRWADITTRDLSVGAGIVSKARKPLGAEEAAKKCIRYNMPTPDFG